MPALVAGTARTAGGLLTLVAASLVISLWPALMPIACPWTSPTGSGVLPRLLYPAGAVRSPRRPTHAAVVVASRSDAFGRATS